MITGAIGTFGHGLSNPGSTTPLVGLSGVCSAMIGAYILLWPQQNIRANHRRTNAAQTDQRGGAAGIGKPMSERTNGTGNHGKNDKFGAPNLSFLP